MSLHILLSRLQGAKRTAHGRYIARCPAHNDRSPSLAIRELDDGRILLHCFAGCTVQEVLTACELTFDALFPEKAIGQQCKAERRPFLPTDVFEIARSELAIVAVIACDMHTDCQISVEDYDRLLTARNRLSSIAKAAYGR
jgi:hypothetical protein